MQRNYKYPNTERLIIAFSDSIKSDSNLTPISKRSYLRSYQSYLSPIFADIDIESMDRTDLGQKLSDYTSSHSGDKLNSTFAWTRKFLFYLIDIHFYKDSRFDFLRLYEHYFSTSSMLVDALLGKIYQNDSSAKVVHNFLHNILSNEDIPILSRKDFFSKSKKYLPPILHDIDIVNMDRYQLGSSLIEKTNAMPFNDCSLTHKFMRRFLYYLIDIGFYPDRRFDFLLHYRSYFEGNSSNTMLSDLLINKYSYQYRVAAMANGNSLLTFIGSASEDVCNIVAEAFGIFTHGFEDIKSFNANFDNSLRPYSVMSVFDFNWQTFTAQCLYLQNVQASRFAYAYLITIYNLIAQRYNAALFEDASIDTDIFTRMNLSRLLYEGYRLVAFNPSEKPPIEDKVLVYFKTTSRTNSSKYTSKTKAIDFSMVACPEYKQLLKDYLWHATPSFEMKHNTCNHAGLFFNYLDDLFTKRAFSLYHIPRNDRFISSGDCMAYVHHVSQHYDNAGTCHAYIKAARLVLQFAIDMNYSWIDPLSTFYLTTHTNSANSAAPICDEELNKISKVINQKAEETAENSLFACIFYLLLTTEFRISELLGLGKDCVKGTMKQGEYVLLSTQKTSSKNTVETPITSETKKHIDFVLSLTSNWRAECANKAIADRLFIVPSHRTHAYTTISAQRFNNFMSLCCCEAKVPYYSASNLRDTHMTKAAEHRMRNGLSELEQKVINGHTSLTTGKKYYIKTNIIDLLEASFGIIIGDVSIVGQISDCSDPAVNTVVSVANQCGYCGANACESYSYLSCLMCSNFIATRAHIPFFNLEIARIEAKIQGTTIPHDVEDLRNIQRLLLAYLAELLKEEDIHVVNS